MWLWRTPTSARRAACCLLLLSVAAAVGPASAFFDPFSWTFAAGTAGVAATCYYTNLCSDAVSWIRPASSRIHETYAAARTEWVAALPRTCPDLQPNDGAEELAKLLSQKLFGQHMVEDVLNKVAFKTSRKKALVLSFQGWTGSGKNLAASLLAEAAFNPEGMRSPYVHLFVYNANKTADYRTEVREGLKRCARSIFIFDEVDKMPEGMLDNIKPFLDFHHEVEGVSPQRATFIFISNSGGREITDVAYNHWKSGKVREDIDQKHLKKLTKQSAYNEGAGGMKGSDIMKGSLVDHFVPFLPLTKDHVKECIREEMAQTLSDNKIIRSELRNCMVGLWAEEHLEDILDEISFWPEETPLYSANGCKSVHSLLSEYAVDIDKYKGTCRGK